jgi:uncharacterized membrane protein YfcA
MPQISLPHLHPAMWIAVALVMLTGNAFSVWLGVRAIRRSGRKEAVKGVVAMVLYSVFNVLVAGFFAMQAFRTSG